MHHLFHTYQLHLERAIADILSENGQDMAVPAAAVVEPPRDAAHGCLATNAAMVLAKPLGLNPRQVAERLQPKLQDFPGVETVEIAGPGFINLRLHPDVWRRELLTITTKGADYGTAAVERDERINVEYVSANPTGPMHIGHARGAVVGDALANLLQKAGYKVTKEYYINDAGAQVDVLARSAHLRYREALGEAIGEIPAGLYPGEYLIAPAQAIAQQDGDRWKRAPEAEWLPYFRQKMIEAMMGMIREDLRALGVAHDVFSSEQAVIASGAVDKALAALEEKGLIYTGVLEAPKGKPVEDWEPRPQLLFRASQFGDDTDRPLKKSDGSFTYFTPDIAYHYDKANRGHDVLVDILGADHGGYAKRIKAAVTAMTDGKACCEVLLCQLVKLLKGGEPYKMSKRAGTFVTLRDMVDEVGKDVLRFMMLTRKNDAALDFDVDKVKEQSRDNPVSYVQYAHARCHSVLRHAQQEHAAAVAMADAADISLLAQLQHDDEMQLIKLLASWPRLVEQAATAFEPHRIAFFLQQVAASFHGLWNRGNDLAELRFLQPDKPEATAARLVLLQSVIAVIVSGLQVMGVEPVTEMK